MTERLARASARRPWLVIASWAAAIVVSFALVATLLDGVLSSEARVTGNPESAQAEELIGERFPASKVAAQRGITEVVVVRTVGIVRPAPPEVTVKDVVYVFERIVAYPHI